MGYTPTLPTVDDFEIFASITSYFPWIQKDKDRKRNRYCYNDKKTGQNYGRIS